MTTHIRMVRGKHPKVYEIRQPLAFALIKYVNVVTGRVEWVWNSRDGVAPVMIIDRLPDAAAVSTFQEGLERARMAELVQAYRQTTPDPTLMAMEEGEAAMIPNFVPPIGMQVFFSFGDAPQPVREHWELEWLGTIAATSDTGLRAEMRNMSSPFDLAPTDPVPYVVDEEVHALLAEDAKTRPWLPAPPPAVTVPGLVGIG